MTESLNDVTRAAYNRWLALCLAGDAGAKAAFAAYMVARTGALTPHKVDALIRSI